jgi:hypothetical protein
MTRRQNNSQWSDGIAAHPDSKNYECKNSLENFLPRFFGIKTFFSSLIIFQRSELSTRSITHLCCCNWRTFWRKNAPGNSTIWSCSCKTMPRHIGHLQPRRYWPTWASSILITQPLLRIWPRRTTICSRTKKNLIFFIFLPTRSSLLLRSPGWTGKCLNFFECLEKARATY